MSRTETLRAFLSDPSSSRVAFASALVHYGTDGLPLRPLPDLNPNGWDVIDEATYRDLATAEPDDDDGPTPPIGD